MQLKRRARGFTLIEALIALAVLSVGLLGAGVMLLESLRAQAESLRRLSAVNLLRDMAERTRANPQAAAHYATASAAPTGAECGEAGCDPTQRAVADLAQFALHALVFLPGQGQAAIAFAPATGPLALDRYVITLRWRDPRATEDDLVTLQVLASPVAG